MRMGSQGKTEDCKDAKINPRKKMFGGQDFKGKSKRKEQYIRCTEVHTTRKKVLE